MNYKQASKSILNNSIDIFDAKCKDDEFFINPDEEYFEDLERLNKLLSNLEITNTPIDDLKSIQRYLNSSVKFDIDFYLSRCSAVKVMIYHLSDDSIDIIKEILFTLCDFVIKRNSEITLKELCNQIQVFSNLFVNEYSVLLPSISNLLHQVIKYDSEGNICKLVNEFGFLQKIDKYLSECSNDQSISTILINCISWVLKKYTNDVFYESDIIFANQDQICQREDLLNYPLEIATKYIVSRDQSTLLPVLKLYRIILIYRSGNIEKYLPNNVFEEIVRLLEESHNIDLNGYLLKSVLKIIDVFIFLYLGNTKNDYTSRVEQIIKILINQIERISKLPSLPLEEVGLKFDKSLQWLPYMIDILGRIAKYPTSAKILSNKSCLDNLFKIYDDLNYQMKCSLSDVFLNVFDQYPRDVINDCDDNGNGDKYNFINVIMNDCIDSLPNISEKEQYEKAPLILRVLYKLLSQDLEIKMLFDEETMFKLLDEYGEINSCYQYCLDVHDLLEKPIEVSDILN